MLGQNLPGLETNDNLLLTAIVASRVATCPLIPQTLVPMRLHDCQVMYACAWDCIIGDKSRAKGTFQNRQ